MQKDLYENLSGAKQKGDKGMLTEPSESHECVRDLLPAYVNQTLEESEFELVRIHVKLCAQCKKDLFIWQNISFTVKQYMTSPIPTATPSALFLDDLPQMEKPFDDTVVTKKIYTSRIIHWLRLLIYQHHFLSRVRLFFLPLAIVLSLLSTSFYWTYPGHCFMHAAEHFIWHINLTTLSLVFGVIGFSLILVNACITQEQKHNLLAVEKG
jgi:hypothetical protein